MPYRPFMAPVRTIVLGKSRTSGDVGGIQSLYYVRDVSIKRGFFTVYADLACSEA